MTLGETIKQARMAKNMSQEDLANEVGVSRQYQSGKVIKLYQQELTGSVSIPFWVSLLIWNIKKMGSKGLPAKES